MTAPSPEIPAALRARAEQVLADYGHPHWWNDRRHGPWSSTAEAINASAEASELLRDASVALTGDPDALRQAIREPLTAEITDLFERLSREA